MAEAVNEHVESALQSLINIVEIGGYLKKEMKDDILKAVSTLRECFSVIKMDESRENAKNKDNAISEYEVNNVQTEGEDSSAGGHVAPSVDPTRETGSGNQHTPTPSGTTSNDDIQPANHDTMLEAKITDKITQNVRLMMDAFTNSVKSFIKEEIANTRENISKPRQRHNNTESETQNVSHTTSEVQTPTTRDMTQDQETEMNTNEEQWTTVTHRRERRPAKQHETLTGAGPSDTNLQAAEKRAWLYVGRLKPETTPDSIKQYLSKKGVKENVICEELTNKSHTKSFKVGIPFHHLELANTAEFWPEGITVRRFRFPRLFRENGGVSLE